MKPRDSLGWPVEFIEGRPVMNFLRLLIHTSPWQTWKWRNGVPQEVRHLEDGNEDGYEYDPVHDMGPEVECEARSHAGASK